MPTLIRFLTIVGLIAGLFYGTMFVLANFFEPQPREMTKTIHGVKVKPISSPVPENVAGRTAAASQQ